MRSQPLRTAWSIVGLVLLGTVLFLPGMHETRALASPEQLITNPYFSQWQSASPVGWTRTGTAAVSLSYDSYDIMRSGPNRAAVIEGRAPGDGVVQANIPVKAGTRYDIYAWVRAPGATEAAGFELRVSGQRGTYLAIPAHSASVPEGWHRLQTTFMAAVGETNVTVAFARNGTGGAPIELWLDDVTLWERAVDPSPAAVSPPAVPLVLYGLEQNVARLSDAETMATFNVFDAYYHTPEFVDVLRSGQKVAAKRVYVPDAGVEELVARWTEPFRDSMEGRLPGGFDAIIIDEVSGWNTPVRSATIADALARTRALYPNRLIYVWGDWKMADVANQDVLLAAINQYADGFILQAYRHELLPQWDLAGRLAANIEQRENATPGVQGLLAKTTIALAPYQSPQAYNADNSAYVDFKAFLEEQFRRIAAHPSASKTRGIGLFAYYYTPPDTMSWFNGLVQHYVIDGRQDYLAPRPAGTLSTEGHVSLLEGRNPRFETPGANWILDGGATYIAYTDVPELRPYHGVTWHQIPHGSRLLRMERDGEHGSIARQAVPVEPSTTYLLNAYAVGAAIGTAVEIGVRDPLGTFEESSSVTNVGDERWTKVGVLFHVPPGVTSVDIWLSDASAARGSVTYWDFVELGPKDAIDVFTPSVLTDPTSLTIQWITDIPTIGEVQVRSPSGASQTVRSSAEVATQHSVVLTDLMPATRYEFWTINHTQATSPAVYTSPRYAAVTRSATAYVPDAPLFQPGTDPPAPPTLVRAVYRDRAMRLEWHASEDAVVGFDVYRADTADGPLTRLNSTPTWEDLYVDTTANPKRRYWYAVRAIDAAGNPSEFSERMESVLESMDIILPVIARD